jgi:hypothetical protein
LGTLLRGRDLHYRLGGHGFAQLISGVTLYNSALALDDRQFTDILNRYIEHDFLALLVLMRKRLITPIPPNVPLLEEGWLNLDGAAVVEVTSEENDYPVESALVSGQMQGWRAADSGVQTIRLVFDESQRLKRIALVFEETEMERTQEFVLRWSGDHGGSFQEIVRQQWNFSPPNSTRDVEEYRVELSGVNVLELVIVPDISGGEARASLKSLRVS